MLNLNDDFVEILRTRVEFDFERKGSSFQTMFVDTGVLKHLGPAFER